jgi:hypothetical protein
MALKMGYIGGSIQGTEPAMGLLNLLIFTSYVENI